MAIRIWKTKYIFLLLLMVFAFLTVTPVRAYAAYSSWVRGTDVYNSYKTGPDKVTSTPADPDEANELLRDKDPNPIEKFFAEIVVDFGSGITQALKAGGIDASTTGIIMGKFTTGVNYFVFDLTDQNPWGLIGAYLYFFFRNLSLSLILVFVTINVGRAVIVGKDKGLGEVKEQIYTLIIFLLLLYIMPQIVDWICEARDIMAIKGFKLLDDILDSSVKTSKLHETISLEGEYLKQYANADNPEAATPSMLNALVYLGICILPFFYVVSYLGLALTEAVLFGCFPLILVFAMSDKKAIHGWCTVVFTNLLVPLLDMILILLPSMVMTLIEAAAKGSGGGTAVEVKGGLLKAIIMIVMFAMVIPTRNKVLSVLGNSYGGIKGGFGLGALAGGAAIAMRAAKGVKGALSGKGGGENGDKGDGESQSEANGNDAEAGKSLKDMQQNLDDVSPEESDNGNGNENSQEADDNNGGPVELGDIGGAPDNDAYTGDPSEDSTEGMGFDGELTGGDAADTDVEGSAVAGTDAEAGVDVNNTLDGDVAAGASIETAAFVGGGDYYSSGVVDEGGTGANPEGEADGYVSSTPKGAETDMVDHTQVNDPIESGGGDGESVPMDTAGELKASERISDDLNDVNVGAHAAANAELNASKMIEDATVKSNGFGNQLDPSLRQTIEENTPASKGVDKDLDKRMNLSRAANLQTMDNLKNRMESLDRENTSAQASIAADTSLMSRNTAKLASLDKKEAKILDKYQGMGGDPSGVSMDTKDMSALNNIRSERQQLESANQAAQDNINSAKATIASNNVAKQAISGELSKRSNIESDFGAMQARRGMNGQTFTSAKDFSRQVVHDNLVRQTANYKNFANSKYSGVLTPQERTQFQRQQNIRRAVGATGKVVGTVAAGAAMTAVGTGAAVALSVGGGEAGAALGGVIAASGVGKMVSGAAVPVNAVGHAMREGAANATTMAISKATPHVEEAAVKAGNATLSAAGKAFDMTRRKVGTATKVAAASLERKYGGNPDAFRTPANSVAANYAEKSGVFGSDSSSSKPKMVPRKYANSGSNRGASSIPTPVASGGGGYVGHSEADMFLRQMNEGAKDPVIRQRENEARKDAAINVEKFNNRGGA